MITGHNTDVRHGNRTFHVQTEDKGLANPRIETLIYVGGQILDSYRSSYEDLAGGLPLTEPAVQDRMDVQHRAIIQDIKNGKYDQTHPDLGEESAFTNRPLSQAILEFLEAEGGVDVLELVLGKPLNPEFGGVCRILVQARRCHSRTPVAGAEITVKLLSSLKKAGMLLSGRTRADGWFQGEALLPPSQPGQCVLVVACAWGGEADEVKAAVLSS